MNWKRRILNGYTYRAHECKVSIVGVSVFCDLDNNMLLHSNVRRVYCLFILPWLFTHSVIKSQLVNNKHVTNSLTFCAIHPPHFETNYYELPVGSTHSQFSNVASLRKENNTNQSNRCAQKIPSQILEIELQHYFFCNYKNKYVRKKIVLQFECEQFWRYLLCATIQLDACKINNISNSMKNP